MIHIVVEVCFLRRAKLDGLPGQTKWGKRAGDHVFCVCAIGV